MSDILNYVRVALDKLYSENNDLIIRRVSERTIVSRFARYLEDELKNTTYQFLNVDVEYNRNKDKPKTLKKIQKGIQPDVLVHHRGYNDTNILALEFKTWWFSDNKEDIEKLKGLTDPSDEFKYEVGLSIILGKEKPIGLVIKNGQVIGDY